MSSVDDRIVNMQFNNKQFQTGAADSTKSLQTLEQTIGGMGSSGNGLDKMGQSVDGIRGKFSALQVAGVTALATIVNKAVNAGLSLAKSLTIDPLLQGFHEYEKTLNSTQTILANTGLEGKKGIEKVNVALKQLNDYSDLTIYNFGQMADSVGKFTAAGVPLKQAVSAIKGLANSAALSGSSVDQLNTAMYQMSQALSTGSIRLMDWNSLANAGMGGKNIRESLMATNRTLGDHGKAMDAAIKHQGNFRDSLREGWLSAETFTKTMKVMAGTFDKKLNKYIPYTVDALKKMGYAEGAAKQLHKLSGAAIESATKVKTFSQLIDVVKEAIGSGWAQVFQDLFGTFDEATKLWTGVSDVITTAVAKIFHQVDLMLLGWKKLGGFQDTWRGFANIFKTFGNLLSPFVTAFKAIFPATEKAGSGLAKASSAFESVTAWMEKASRGASALTPFLLATFGLLKDLGTIASTALKALSPLVDVISHLASELGGLVQQGVDIGTNILEGLLQGMDVNSIKTAIQNFANSIVTWIKNALGIHSPAAALVPVGTSIVQGIAQGIGKALSFLIDAIGKVAGAIVHGFGDLFGGMDVVDWVSFFNLALLGGLIFTIQRFIHSFGGILQSIVGPFQQMTSTLKTMQTEIKAAMILQIAIAVGILTASLIALSFLDPKKIAIGLGALASMMALMVGSLATLDHVDSEGLFASGAAILAISTAMLVLSSAIAILGNLGLDTLAKGLGAIAIGLGIMVVSLQSMTGLGVGLPAAATAILIMATAMSVMSGAVALLGNMSMKTLALGLGAMAIGLVLFTNSLIELAFVGPAALAGAGAIIIVATAMTIMAGAIGILGTMDMKTLAVGLGAMAIGLALFVATLMILSGVGPEAFIAAKAIIIMSTAMLVLATALEVIGNLSLAQLATGLGTIAIALGILLLAAAGAEAVAPGLIVLSGALLSIGGGVALFGAGLLAAAAAFAIFTAIGSAGIAVLGLAFTTLMALLPAFAVQVATSVVLFIETIASMAPRLRVAFGEILAGMLGTIKDAIPQIQELTSEMLASFLTVLEDAIPQVKRVIQAYIDAFIGVVKDSTNDIVNAGLDIIDNFLSALARHLPSIIRAGTNIVVAVIKGIGAGAVTIANAAAQTLLDFINGLTTAIDTYAPQIRTAAVKLAWAIIDGLTGGLLDKGVTAVKNAITTLLDKIPTWAQKLLGIQSPSKVSRYWGEMLVAGFVKGIGDGIKNAVGATVALANAVIAAGDAKVAEAQKNARKRQIAAAKAAAKAHVSDTLAIRDERAAKKSPKNATLQKEAKAARKLADQQAKAADKAQKLADSANEQVSNLKTFQTSDNQGKGDIKSDFAKSLSDRAVKALALANAEAVAAKKLRGKERDAMLRQAREDARAAKALADRSKAASDQANVYYARSVNERIKTIEDEKKARDQAAADQEKFDSATPAEQVDILKTQAAAAQKRSEAAFKASEALIEQAKKLAKTDARKAQTLLDKAEVLAQTAQDAATDAQNFSDQAKQIEGSSTGGTFQISKTVMEDAAKAIDRMTESLQLAEADAAAQAPVVQFVQHNNSPESLSDIEIYRQTKNLLSAAEIKMAATTP